METERGCGWRQIGGVYLVSDMGYSMPCDSLPLKLRTCPLCDFTIKQSRSMQGVHAGYLAGLMAGHDCHDDYDCPLCGFASRYALAKNATTKEERKQLGYVPEDFFLMYVSKGFYTPQAFIAEAKNQGVSKRIPPNSLPKKFVVGRDWVFLAHKETPFYAVTKGDLGTLKTEAMLKPAIFYAFKPSRLELVLWKGTDAKEILKYEDAGYSVVLLDKTPENLSRHGDGLPPPLPAKKKREGGAD